jgi:L-amino acid N-acyltransferase
VWVINNLIITKIIRNSMEINFRKAISTDLSKIADVYNYYVRTSNAVYDEHEKDEAEIADWYEQKQKKELPVVIAEVNGEFIGYGTFGQFRPWGGFRFCVEHSLYVKEEFKGRGVGKRLLSCLIEEAKQRNMRSMVAGIDSENRGSVHLHALLGFEVIGIFKNAGYKKGMWLDLTMMQLQLGD